MFATWLLLGMPLLAAFALAVPVAPVADTGRFVYRESRIRHVQRRYAVWLPPGHATRATWPAIVFLHGAGECGTDGVRPTRIGLGPALEARPRLWPFVVVFPQKPLEDEEWEEREGMVLGILDDARRHFAIDTSRVALAGMSQGGHGTWMIGARHPERWRCLVPVCGYGRARAVQRRAVRVPVWAFHGLRDDVVNPEDTRAIVAGLRAERAARGLDPDDVRMTLFPDANHNSWDPAFAHDSLTVWLKERLGAR